jgi:protein-S-isoprenylcysteine O-methyltransferase Ste14
MRQASNLKNLELDLLLPGFSINTSRSDYRVVKEFRMSFALRLQIVFGWPHQKERRFTGPAMADTADTANVIVRPPIAWALAVLAGLALNWLMPLPFLPAVVSAGWLGAIVCALALALVAWAISTMTRAGSNVPTRLPTTTIVETGPYRFTRNPIYLGMVLGLIGLAIAFNSLWLLMTLVPFALVIRYGVITREEAYLERKFGDVYRRYRARVRRWL